MTNNIRVKLANIQQELKAPKNQYNSFGRYNYRNCEDILEALKPLLEKHKCTLVISDDIILVGDRYYVKAMVNLKDLESSDEIFTSALAREEQDKKGMDGSQITGASSSYARKYALNGLFAIDDTKDSDTTNVEGKKTSPQPPKTKISGGVASNKVVVCSTCGGATTLREGTNKNGKKWKGYFCQADSNHAPKFVSVKQNTDNELIDKVISDY